MRNPGNLKEENSPVIHTCLLVKVCNIPGAGLSMLLCVTSFNPGNDSVLLKPWHKLLWATQYFSRFAQSKVRSLLIAAILQGGHIHARTNGCAQS